MDNENGLDSEDEFEIDCALLSGREVEIRFVAPLTERVDEGSPAGSDKEKKILKLRMRVDRKFTYCFLQTFGYISDKEELFLKL